MSRLPLATFGLSVAGAGAFCSVLAADVEPQPEYPELMTDPLRLLGAGIALGGLAIGFVFLCGRERLSGVRAMTTAHRHLVVEFLGQRVRPARLEGTVRSRVASRGPSLFTLAAVATER